MKRRLAVALALAAIVSLAACATATRGPAVVAGVGDAEVRPPALAGRFYPSDPARLRRAVEVLSSGARPLVADDVVAVVAPHAGYMFSGQIAADALAYLGASQPDVVVVLGANHTAPPVRGFALHPGRAFRTPLGDVQIDRELTRALLDAGVNARADAAPHAEEHSIEVVLPFLQVLAPRTAFVPVIVGSHDLGETERFGRALATSLAGRRALIVASADLSHYPTAPDAVTSDRATLELISRFDRDALLARERQLAERQPASLVTYSCGTGPLLVAMSAARALGAAQATVASYANSSDVAVGDAARVVGYGAVVFHRDEARHDTASSGPGRVDGEAAGTRAISDGPLDPAERQALLALARTSFTQFLQSETLPLARDLPASLAARRQGAFVTIKQRGQLRGCVGRVVADAPLPQLVSRAAFEAAFRDPRFTPLTRSESERVEVEVSLLTSPSEVTSPRDIVVGRDGVILVKSGRSAVFLPQVATEAGWTREQMLDALCAKAELRERCWTDRARLLTFQAEVFAEHDARR